MECLNCSHLSIISPPLELRRISRETSRFSKAPPPPLKCSFRVTTPSCSQGGNALASEDLLYIFLQERRSNGDFISKAADLLFVRDELRAAEENFSVAVNDNAEVQKVNVDEETGGYLKLTQTQEWINGVDVVPLNRRQVKKDWQNDRERVKKLEFLRYDALKRELMLLTGSIGIACSGYCLLVFSLQVALSYGVGVLFSCLYLQLVCIYADNISREMVPRIFLQKKIKKIGIRSDDLRDSFERVVRGSTLALSSPRLVIPAAIFGLWGLSHKFLPDYLELQLVPAMLGTFAYKAAALVQVYRDNEDLKLIFPDSNNYE